VKKACFKHISISHSFKLNKGYLIVEDPTKSVSRLSLSAIAIVIGFKP